MKGRAAAHSPHVSIRASFRFSNELIRMRTFGSVKPSLWGLIRNLIVSLQMQRSMAASAKCDQVLLGIISEVAPRFDMVYLEFANMSTALAPPAVALQYLMAQPSIGFRVESQSRASWAKRRHEAFRTCSRNSCCLGRGRNSKSRPSEISKASGFPFSRLAPAKKSAQIISRQ